MTIQEAKDKIAATNARTDIGPAAKAAINMRIRSQALRDNSEADPDELV